MNISGYSIFALMGVLAMVGYIDALTKRIPTTEWTMDLQMLLIVIAVGTIVSAFKAGANVDRR